MKKLAIFVFAFLLAASLSFAQTGGDKKKSDNPQESSKANSKSGKKGHHKGGKKSKKGSGGTATPAPK